MQRLCHQGMVQPEVWPKVVPSVRRNGVESTCQERNPGNLSCDTEEVQLAVHEEVGKQPKTVAAPHLAMPFSPMIVGRQPSSAEC